ncbi:MAG: ABC transporter ATP-binding protein [Rhodobacterales bacterium]|nr:ABC transporter ATP-binding protein [Rhodobacterales bacterium]
MPEIVIDKLSKSFANAHAVRDVSLTVKAGSFTCILGPSGCGKTTLLRMIAGLEEASAGQIRIGGRLVDDPVQGTFVPPEQRGVGLVFQSYALWPHMTVVQNVEFGLRLQRLDASARRARTRAMLDTLRITELADRYPAHLSGGQQQRVALARTLALAPQVLLLDEPLSNLDASLRLAMRAELARLHREFGTTIVFVTHDQWEAMTLATDIAVLAEGEVQQTGSASTIYDRPTTRFVAEFIGSPPINILPAGSPAAMSLIPQGVPERDQITVGLRPEAVRISDRSAPGSLSATVTAVLPTGGSWIVETAVQADGIGVVCTTLSRPIFVPMQPVFLEPQNDGMHLFGPNGRRLSDFPSNLMETS